MVDLENVLDNLFDKRKRDIEFKLIDSVIDIYNGKYDTYEQYINECEQKIKESSNINGLMAYIDIYILSEYHFYYIKDKGKNN